MQPPLTVWLAIAFVTALAAQPAQAFRSESRVVLVNAAVIDDNNKFVTGLKSEHFRLLDNGQSVQVQAVALEDAPISTIILLDVSGSMKKTIGFAREALARFLSRTREGDEYCLVLFRATVDPQCEFTSDARSVAMQAQAVPDGDTAVIDAIVFGMRKIKTARNTRRAILILSDAADTASRYTWKDARRYALESTATLYAVSPPVWNEEEEWNSAQLRSIVEITGGRYLIANKNENLAQYMDRLEVRLQYVISYSPVGWLDDGRFHKIKLQLQSGNSDHQRAYWRRGYYAPAQ